MANCWNGWEKADGHNRLRRFAQPERDRPGRSNIALVSVFEILQTLR